MTAAPATQAARSRLWPGIVGTLAFLAIAAYALNWAKWGPYAAKLSKIYDTGRWPGSDILAKAGGAGSSPSIAGAWSFTTAYANAVWMALVAGLLIAAGIESLLPRRWLLRMLARKGVYAGSLAGGLCSLPSLMCTCCTAPVAATLRRQGVPTSSALAYWLGNPVLNPAVLAFLAIVAPWQWVTTRIAVGLLLVFGATAVIGKLDGHGREIRSVPALDELPPFRLREAPRRFAAALARLSVTLLPEYLVVVFLLGLFRGWLFPLGGNAVHWGVLAVIAAALLGTLIVIPTGGEIPVTQALAAAGASTGVIGALLITLPAISIVSMAMVVRQMSLRVTAAAAGAVAFAGLLAAAVLAGLT